MKNVMCYGLVAVVLAVSGAASAQDRKMDDKMDDKMDKMKSETSYTGCIERSPDGAFTLGHAMARAPRRRSRWRLHGEGSMRRTRWRTIDDEGSHGVDARPGKHVGRLAKHVGHKVIVKGVAGDTMGGMATFTVKSIKMVGSSCSLVIAW